MGGVWLCRCRLSVAFDQMLYPLIKTCGGKAIAPSLYSAVFALAVSTLLLRDSRRYSAHIINIDHIPVAVDFLKPIEAQNQVSTTAQLLPLPV